MPKKTAKKTVPRPAETLTASVPERATLADCLASEVVELAELTPEGGTMYGRFVPPKTKVMISWQAGEHTFVYVSGRGHPSGAEWSRLVSLPSTARVARVLVSRASVPTFAAQDADEVDPLQQRTADAADGPLLRSK